MVREYFTITEKAPNSVLNVKALVGAFNQEKALSRSLIRDFEIFVNLRRHGGYINFIFKSR